MSRAEIQYRAKLRKFAKLLRRRERILDKINGLILDESVIDWKTANSIQEYLAQEK